MRTLAADEFDLWTVNKPFPPCEVCGEEVDEGYGECEVCGKFVCAEHNNLVKGVCPECQSIQDGMLKTMIEIGMIELYKSLILKKEEAA